MPKTTIIVGAGATRSEAVRLGLDPLPPLDRGFFLGLSTSRPSEFQAIKDYMLIQYGVDILDQDQDRLEAVMAAVYTDVRHPELGPAAAKPFLSLIRSINGELAATTNKMKADSDSHLYRLLSKQIESGVPIDEIAFVTFNYDLQIEKSLEALEMNGIVGADGVTLNFPYCYHLPTLRVTGPSGGQDQFTVGKANLSGVAVYKLHGSLNWYSSHNSRNPSMSALLRTNRMISLTRRRSPNVGMTLSGNRKTYAFPVVVPPVLNKSAILPTGFARVWKDAEAHLALSKQVIIFGYSCPPLDFESANLIARSLRASAAVQVISIIDPNPDVITRYAGLSRVPRIAYYRDVEHYLS